MDTRVIEAWRAYAQLYEELRELRDNPVYKMGDGEGLVWLKSVAWDVICCAVREVYGERASWASHLNRIVVYPGDGTKLEYGERLCREYRADEW
ncbi:hypothetical protein CL654_00240 [bacterium]|nr:hypothetical protein [bacterium]|tara:strand:- start:477 stop:758 length:282 start_codon:yes stop_codon:yes gene_type:complete